MKNQGQISQPVRRALHAGFAGWVLLMGNSAYAETASVPAATPATSTQQAALISFNIPAQALGSAILAYAEQAGVQVFFDSAKLAGLQAQALQGRYSVQDGLAMLLRSMPVSYRFEGDRQVRLERLPEQGGALELGLTNITGQRLDDAWVYESPRSVSVISQEQIKRNPPRHAADMLEQTSGVYTAVSQQDPGLSVNIRGVQDYGRVNMNIDGMRQNYQQSGHQQRNGTMYIDPELLSGVTVEKGATSGMGGAGVIGGVAQFSTLNARDFIHEGTEFGGRIRATTGLGGYANGTDFIGSSAFALGNEIGDILVAASERHLGDYDPGTNGEIGELRTGTGNIAGVQDRVKNTEVAYSGSVMKSRLAKLGFNLPQDQRVQVSYLRTHVTYDDASIMDVQDSDALWSKNGSSDVLSQNYAIDYSYSPDNNLIDLSAKLYYVDTRNKQSTLASGANRGYDVTYQTDTYGLQLENTSVFALGERSTLSANYGLEYFIDKVRPDSNQAVASTSAVDYPVSEGMTPKGDRTMGSLFTNLEFEYDSWLTLSAGLRYDRYRLEGETGFNTSSYRTNGTNQLYTVPVYYDVDREEGKFSPTFGIAIKPGVDWLQLFASYGEGWRPPAVTETLISGRPHSGGTETMYPNPFLKPESSQSWEVGFNILKENLLTDGDAAGLKVSYFDTRIEDFMFMAVGLQRPGAGLPALGIAAYVNDLSSTRFRGVEYSFDYDAGAYYSNFTYTHMIGENQYCKQTAWLGGATSPVYSGTGTRRPIVGNAPNVAANAATSCGGMMGTAEHMPMDRGSLTLGTRLLDSKLDIGARARYSEGYALEQGDTAAQEQIYPADWKTYTVYDLYGSYKATDALTLRLALDNFTDRAYLVPLGDVLAFTLGRGRTLQGTVEYTF